MNDHPTMKTWQAEAFAVYQTLGELARVTGAADKMDWDAIESRAAAQAGDPQFGGLVAQTVRLIREAAEAG